MPRRRQTILLPLCAVLAASAFASGCSAVTDGDVAARVNDAELSNADLSGLVEVIGGGVPPGPSNGDAVRNAVQLWVLVEATGAQLEADGTPLSDEDIAAAAQQVEEQVPGIDEQSAEVRDTLTMYFATANLLETRPDGNDVVLAAIEAADIHIDPRVGALDPTVGVIPLGGGAPVPGLTG